MKTLWGRCSLLIDSHQVYEACKRAHRCSYFIVTTYDHWVFGNMSQDSTTASVSSVFDFSERSGVYHRPSLLQLVTYWELLSIGEAHQDAPSVRNSHSVNST